MDIIECIKIEFTQICIQFRPSTECRKMTVVTLKLLDYLRDCLIEKKAKECGSILFAEYKKCFEVILAQKELRSRWFIIESVMFILNFVKAHEQALQDIKKGGKRIQKKVKEDFAAFVEFSNYLCGSGQESFSEQVIELGLSESNLSILFRSFRIVGFNR